MGFRLAWPAYGGGGELKNHLMFQPHTTRAFVSLIDGL